MRDDTKNGCVTDYPYFDSHFNFSTTATSPQRPLFSVPKVTVVQRFNGSATHFQSFVFSAIIW